jgi:hypothetical protein
MLNSKTKSRLVIGLAVAICLVGLFLRAYFFGINRSLWVDEAMLALNIVNRSIADLLKPLDLDQGAPVGFLLLQKAVVSLLGSSDYTLRIIPFVAGLASIPLMYLVSKQYLEKSYALLSIGLFALSPALIYYSSELKQYSIDVLITLILLLITSKCLKEKASPRVFVGLGIAGSLALWVSHSSLFVLAGIFLTMGLVFAVQKNSHRLLWLIGLGVVWGINLILLYFINLRYLESNNSLLSYWSNSFAPLPPWSNFRWYYRALIGMLSDPATLPINLIVVGLLIIGVLSFAIRRWQLLFVLLAPFLLTLIASALGKYPFSGRLLLFLVPLLFLLLDEGAKRATTILSKVNRPMATLFYASIIVYFLYHPIAVAYKNIQSPPMGEHLKPVMAYIRENYLSTDLIYVYYGGSPAWEYYMPSYGFDQSDYIVGLAARDEPAKYMEDIENLRGSQRVWFVFSHNCSWCVVNEKEFILEHLNEIGVKRGEVLSDDASAYLYDLQQLP